MELDVLIRGGRVIDPANARDEIADVGFRAGRVAAVEKEIPPERARRVVEAAGLLVTPGLIDLHSHVYWGGTSLGVDADGISVRSATTTFVDAGSAGAGNFLGFRRHVMERSRARILAYLNISFAGIFGFSSNLMVGECEDLRLCDPREVVPAARDHADVVVGVKVRTGRVAGGRSGVAPLDMALEAADALQLPVMAHIDHPPPSRTEVVSRLRRKDVLTHCFKPFPNSPLDGRGEIWEGVRAARDRGVYFDIGHGMASLDFDVARQMIAQGFAPDVVSSDVHLFCVDGPAFDLLVCLSKLLNLGMDIVEIVRSATQTPAEVIGRTDLGSLTPGAAGDAAVLRLVQGRFPYVDATGKTLTGDRHLVSAGIVMGGQWIPNEGADVMPALEHFQPHPVHSHADAVARRFHTRHPAR